MLGMLRVGVAERRRRLAVRHALCPTARLGDPVALVRRLVALHATDPASVFLGLAARTASMVPASIEHALYEQRALVRMLGMRRTMFVVPSELVAVVERSTMERIASAQRRLLVSHLGQAGAVRDPAGWLGDVERAVLRALAERGGTATAAQLSAHEPRLRTSLLLGEGKPYQRRSNITSRVLLLLGAQGRVVRGRPTGSWVSQRYLWTLTEQWLPAPDELPSPARARAALAQRWLRSYGPAPIADLQWWTGWPVRQVRQAVADCPVVEVDLGGVAGIALADELDGTPDSEPWAALLPALDSTVMGWSDRGWFLGDHGRALFDRAGNAGPTVWLNGRIVGGWAQRRDGDITIRALEDIGAEGTALVQAEASRLTGWLGDVRITPRFRTPTERELSG